MPVRSAVTAPPPITLAATGIVQNARRRRGNIGSQLANGSFSPPADGRADIFLANDGECVGCTGSVGGQSALLLQTPDERLEDVTATAGLPQQPPARTNVAVASLCRSNSRRAKTATNASLRTMRRRSGSLSGAGRFRCSTESWRDCGANSYSTGRSEHFERLKVFLLGQSEAPYAALAREMNTSEERSKLQFTGFARGIANSFGRKSRILWPIRRAHKEVVCLSLTGRFTPETMSLQLPKKHETSRPTMFRWISRTRARSHNVFDRQKEV